MNCPVHGDRWGHMCHYCAHCHQANKAEKLPIPPTDGPVWLHWQPYLYLGLDSMAAMREYVLGHRKHLADLGEPLPPLPMYVWTAEYVKPKLSGEDFVHEFLADHHVDGDWLRAPLPEAIRAMQQSFDAWLKKYAPDVTMILQEDKPRVIVIPASWWKAEAA